MKCAHKDITLSINILDEIVEKRKKDINTLGYNLGIDIPTERVRNITPFLDDKGSILEIKRASPSKGDIAPGLDAVETAISYCQARTSAISVLTESHYFKGSLSDLIDVCAAVDNYASLHPERKKIAVLRKDFLLCPEEVEIAYRCGADAVLLISRILDVDMMVAMACKCQALGITAFIELRLDEDLMKLSKVREVVDSKFIVCGVNARDLKDFSIDLLTPASMLRKIQSIMGEDARVVFESGIRTPEAASFAGSLGFKGMLLGEAAARNPESASSLVSCFVDSDFTDNSRLWLRYSEQLGSKRPFVKICGLTNIDDALKAAELGADFLGFIFCSRSPRNVGSDTVRTIAEVVRQKGYRCNLVAVITDTTSIESVGAINLVRQGVLDCVQLHGCSDVLLSKSFDVSVPHYTAINVNSADDVTKIDKVRLIGESRILIDARIGDQLGGTGTLVPEELIKTVSHKTKLWLAGGVTPVNVKEIVGKYNPELIDVCSGVEKTKGIKDHAKLESLFAELKVEA